MILLDASYSAKAFAVLVARESDDLELKTSASSKPLQETLVSFSNTFGGTILIGVREDRTVVGRTLDQGTDDQIHQTATAAHSIGRYHVSEIAVAGRPVVAVTVERRSEGFAQTSDGRVLVRRGARNHALLGDELRRFISERSLRRFETAESELGLGDAEPRLLAELGNALGWGESTAMMDRLKEHDLALDSGHLTFAGALLLTDQERGLGVAKFHVDLRVYDTDDSHLYRRRDLISGPLHEQIRQATEVISRDLGNDLVIVGPRRYELPRLPPRAVREVVANAVAHRSYELDRSPIVIEVRPGRLAVVSPGRLPEPVTIKTLREAQAARNPAVLRVLRALNLAEDAGRGIDVIEDEMADAMLSAPEFEETDDFVTVVLPVRGPVSPEERAWLLELQSQGALEPVDRALLVHASRGVVLTNGLARELTGLDSTEARRALQRLRLQGLLEQRGARGGASYRLADFAPPSRGRLMTPAAMERLILDNAAEGPLSNADVRMLTGLDRNAARAMLKRLVKEGHLVQGGSRRGTRYSPGTRQ